MLHGVATMGDGADVEQSLADRSAILVDADAAIKLADEHSATAMCHGIHGRHHHQGGVALVGSDLKFGVSVGCIVL